MDLVLGMAGVHSFLKQCNRPTAGYETHCMFIKRKAASFLYTNTANVLYDRFVTDKVISGEYHDYPSACAEGSLEYFCDSYRREHHVNHGGPLFPGETVSHGRVTHTLTVSSGMRCLVDAKNLVL